MDKYSPKTKCFSYRELQEISVFDNGEHLVDIREQSTNILCGPGSERMVPYVGRAMLVRQGVFDRIHNAQSELTSQFHQYQLKVYYAYRHPEVQRGNFDRFLEESRIKFPSYTEAELYEYVHHYMAIPDVAGHPVGGAIDITIETPEGELDMGAGMADFSDMEKVHTFSQTISEAQLANRLLLRSVLKNSGFAPYDFEWWHFSYGDREWACYYGLKESFYDAIDYRLITP